MNQLLRLLMVAGVVAGVIVVVSLGFVRHEDYLMGPVAIVLFLTGLCVYLLPFGLALYRDCQAIGWIAALNVLLGWTIIGWFAALGWAATGKVRGPGHFIGTPPTHPVLGH